VSETHKTPTPSATVKVAGLSHGIESQAIKAIIPHRTTVLTMCAGSSPSRGVNNEFLMIPFTMANATKPSHMMKALISKSFAFAA
jgi:hypothetical protein